MSIAYLQTNQEIVWDGVHYIIDRLIENEWQLLDLKTKKAVHLKQEDLLEKYRSGEISFHIAHPAYFPDVLVKEDGTKVAALFDLYPLSEQEKMRQKRLFLESYLQNYGDLRSQRWLAMGITEIWKEAWGIPPHPATAARWLKRYLSAQKDIRSLGMAHARKGNTKPRYEHEVTRECNLAISRIYLRLERGSIGATLVEAQKQIRTLNLTRPEGYKYPMPTKSYIASLIQKIPKKECYAKRFGKTSAEHKFRNAVHGSIADKPLQLVEIDHTPLDLHVVDGITGLPLGRPYITLIEDVHTRALLAFCISFIPPSHTTVAQALKMALLPKTNIKLKWPSIRGHWPMFGCMANLRMDNGLEFHGFSLEAACLHLGINIEYCPRKKSWWKGHIERALGTLNRAVTDGMPGRTFSSTTQKGDYDSVSNAAIPLEIMEEMIAKWIVDIYHQEVHGETGLKPFDAWQMGIQASDIPLVDNISNLDAVIGVIDVRKLTHRGIERNHLRYNSDELGAVRERFGDFKISIRWNAEDLGYIHVLPPDGSILQVPVIPKFTGYAMGLTEYQHALCKAYSKNFLEGKNDVEALSIAKAEIRELAEKGIRDTKRKTRAQAQRLRFKAQASAPSVDTQAMPKEIPQPAAASPRPKFQVRRSTRTNMKAVYEPE